MPSDEVKRPRIMKEYIAAPMRKIDAVREEIVALDKIGNCGAPALKTVCSSEVSDGRSGEVSNET
jgi:hypothetical protein